MGHVVVWGLCSRQWSQVQRRASGLHTIQSYRSLPGRPRLASQASPGEQQEPVGFRLAVMHWLCVVGLQRPQVACSG